MDNRSFMDDKPQVLYTPQTANPYHRRQFKPGYLFYVLAAVVIIEVLWGVTTLLTPVRVKKVNNAAPISAAGATLTLASSQKEVKAGDVLLVNINLKTGGYKTIGMDAVLKYDPRFLEVSSPAFTGGKIFSEYPKVEVDGTAGMVKVSGTLTAVEGGFEGTGLFGTVSFKTKVAGQTVIQPDFIKDSYVDSNIIELGTTKDILEKVDNLEVNIK